MSLRTALLFFSAVVLLLTLQVLAAKAPEPVRFTLTVDGITRTALVYPPAKAIPQGAPVVFGFHGQGDNGSVAARSFRIQENWPEAVVVYPEGLATLDQTNIEGLQSDWQTKAGEAGDRDVKFFDALLVAVRQRYQTDAHRTYATGHANGAVFTYLLACARPGVFAAIAPSAGGFPPGTAVRPIPVFQIAGEDDAIAPFANQERSMAMIRKINGCDAKPQPWGAPRVKGCLCYASSLGTPFVSYIHPAGHVYPEEARALVVRFFQEHPAPRTS
jgi:polyhydroxybutyrate depolymerase